MRHYAVAVIVALVVLAVPAPPGAGTPDDCQGYNEWIEAAIDYRQSHISEAQAIAAHTEGDRQARVLWEWAVRIVYGMPQSKLGGEPRDAFMSEALAACRAVPNMDVVEYLEVVAAESDTTVALFDQ